MSERLRILLLGTKTMIKEKMLELLLLEKYNNIITFEGKEIVKQKLWERLATLRREFLEPYVIDSTSKE